MNLRTVEGGEQLDFTKLLRLEEAILPAIIVDSEQFALGGMAGILMQGFMNREAYDRTVETGLVTFWSRSRQELWQKGETSGNTLAVRAIYTDCDQDVVLIDAEPTGPICHTGADSCFQAIDIGE